MAKLFEQSSILAGTIIGAGIFSLPFVFKTAGLASGFFYLALGAVVYIIIYLMYADVILRTEGEHRFVGYSRIYLGKWAFGPVILMAIVEMILVLTIYLILSQSFANLMFQFGGGTEKIAIFWGLASAAIFLRLRRLAFLELLITGGIIGIILLIFAFALPNIGSLDNISFWPDWSLVLLPLAPILFSLSGRVAVPEVVKFNRRPEAIKQSVILGVLAPTVVYAIFVTSILSLSAFVSEDAVSSLFGKVPVWVLPLVGTLGILSIISSYITVGLDVKESLAKDLKLPYWLAALIVVAAPLTFYFIGFQDFIGLISFVGGIFLGLEGIFIVGMWLAVNKKIGSRPILLKNPSPAVIFLLLAIFAAAIVYEILKI